MANSWNGKPYYSFDAMLKERFSTKVYKVALNGGMSCPNRDGTLGNGGCISAVPEVPATLPEIPVTASPPKLRFRLTASEKNVGQKNLLPIFKRTQTPTLPLTIWKRFLQRHFLIPMLSQFLSAHAPIALETMSLHF